MINHKQSLGLIEVVGLSAAIEAADAALKSANVNLLGYELTKGGGLIVVKLSGEVAAINAALEAATTYASKVNQVFTTKVIARMADNLDIMLGAEHNQQGAIANSLSQQEQVSLVDSANANNQNDSTIHKKQNKKSKKSN